VAPLQLEAAAWQLLSYACLALQVAPRQQQLQLAPQQLLQQ
jgi:hypothetical protein